MKELARAALESERRQPVGEDGAGIDADAVRPDNREMRRRMSMHHNLAERVRVVEKGIPDPDQKERSQS